MIAYLLSGGIDVAWLLPFAAGNFLYIGAADLIPQLHAEECPGSEAPAGLKERFIQLAAFLLLSTDEREQFAGNHRPRSIPFAMAAEEPDPRTAPMREKQKPIVRLRKIASAARFASRGGARIVERLASGQARSARVGDGVECVSLWPPISEQRKES